MSRGNGVFQQRSPANQDAYTLHGSTAQHGSPGRLSTFVLLVGADSAAAHGLYCISVGIRTN